MARHGWFDEMQASCDGRVKVVTNVQPTKPKQAIANCLLHLGLL